ncbi:MAG: alpha/beta hydrolase [Burkholderiaceae bacterium]|nr:alpha/beta hydrolase [Burkholderiaceae bacterium]
MTLHDDAWHDGQYNNRARVPEAAQILERWAHASEHARRGMTALIGERYGPAAGEALDVFPARSSSSPVLVFIHGGYWRALSKAEHSFVAPAFVQAGAMVVVPDYALCPAVDIATIALQTTRALDWVWRHARQFGGDPSRIVVVGHSAGGHLAAMLLACRWKQVAEDLPARLVGGALSLSGLFDLEPIRQTPFLQGDLRLTPAAVRRLSPAFFPRPKGPLVALVGGDESPEFLRQNQLIRDQWGPSTVPVCESLPGCNHFTVMHDLVDPAGRSHGHARRLLGLGG